MFRFSNRILRKAHNVASRYISHDPLPLSKQSYKERFPPLIHSLPSLNLPLSRSNSQGTYPTKITTLPNGLRIASQDTPGPAACIGIFVDSGSIHETKGETGISHLLERLAFKDTKNRTKVQIVREVESYGRQRRGVSVERADGGPAACVGIFVDSGSIYETKGKTGISHLLEHLAFKDTKNRTKMQIVREIERTGGNVGASASREQMGYSYDVLKGYLENAVELLADCVRNPAFLESEVQEQLNNAKNDVAEAEKDPQRYLMESLHHTGFTGALSDPLLVPDWNIKNINAALIEKFYFDNYTADRIVLSVSGVDHRTLLEIAEPLFCDLQPGPTLDAPLSAYVGGDVRHKADSEVTHVALAFRTPGGWRQDKDATVLTVLQTLMGGGGSFSSGGPGKGMHSRLYVRVLNLYHQIQSFSAFSSLYNDTGLFGITFSAPSNFAGKAVTIAAGELIAIATPGGATELELNRAKNATKSAILMSLESRAVIAEDIGRQILTYGDRKPVEYFLECIDEMRVEDITNMAQKILSTPLTLSCWGDVDSVPSYSSVEDMIYPSVNLIIHDKAA